ncbi:MAG: FliA/WhiG family RNA polymerase sigma factor [Terriglobia bacterium]
MSTVANVAQRKLQNVGAKARPRRANLGVHAGGERNQPVAALPRPTRAHECPSRDELAVTLLPLVRRVAFEMRERLPQHVEVDDLAGAGVLGLLDAVRKFDACKHVKIETYARHRIRGAILDSLREMDTASRDMRRKNKAAEKVYQELYAKLGRAVTDEEMAIALGISLKKWYRTVEELNSVGSEWMRPNQIPEASRQSEAGLPADDRDSAFDRCYRIEQRELLARASSTLPGRERAVLSYYYEHEMTMSQIGDTLGIDESRVSQIHSAAILHLRARARKMLNPASGAIPPAFIAARAANGTAPLERAS